MDRKITAESGEILLDKTYHIDGRDQHSRKPCGITKGRRSQIAATGSTTQENGSEIGEQQQQHGVSDTKPGGSETRVLGHPRVFGWTRGDIRSVTLG